jgi:hypothetical protein
MISFAGAVLTAALLAETGSGGYTVKDVTLSPEASKKPLMLDCPVNVVTRLVLPEASARLVGSPGMRERFGLVKAASAPLAVVLLQPKEHPARGTLDVWGRSGEVYTFDLRTVEKGESVEVRIHVLAPHTAEVAPTAAPTTPPPAVAPTLAPAVTIAPTTKLTVAPTVKPSVKTAVATPTSRASTAPTPSPVVASIATPVPTSLPTAEPTISASEMPGVMHDVEMNDYKPETVNESVSLPGQLPFVLEDKRVSRDYRWYSFRLKGGANESITSVRSPEGEITTFRARSVEHDLRVIVEVPNASMKKKQGLEIRLASGATYKFHLKDAGLGRVFSDGVNIFKKD